MKSDAIGKIALALSKAQSKIHGAITDSQNPFFKSKYADLSSVMDAIRDPFTENELSFTQTVNQDDKGVYLITLLMHSSGEWIESKYPIVVKEISNPQAVGSAVTYARRYALAAIAGVAQIDDDGNQAVGHKVENKSLPNHAPKANDKGNVSTVNNNYVVNENQLRRLYALQHKANMSHADLAKLINIKTDKKDAKELLKSEYDIICGILEGQK